MSFPTFDQARYLDVEGGRIAYYESGSDDAGTRTSREVTPSCRRRVNCGRICDGSAARSVRRNA
jgi:hypothetical protein